MVLPILIAVITAPGLLGIQEAIRQSQAKEKREEHRARRCNLIATCVKSSMRSREINGRPIVLKSGKLYIDTGTSNGEAFGHPYAGYYLPYPDEKYEGLVTTITDEAPIMNWVYVDKDTHEVKYGVRVNAQPNLTGPFDCTRQDRRLTFAGWEGWCAVEEFPTIWSLYFDKDDDGLRSKVTPGTRVLEIELTRKEKRWKKDVDARQQDQTTKRAVDTKEDVPADKPVTEQPQLDPPGVKESVLEPLKIQKSIFTEQEQPSQPQPQPPLRPKTPPSVGPADMRILPPSDRRGVLNRNRNSKTLAQAQMFEAMSQKSTPVRPKDGKALSRPTSAAGTASDTFEPRISTDAPPAYTERPDSSILAPSAPAPAPQGKPKLQPPISDPAIFGAYAGEAPAGSTQRNRSDSSTSTNSPNQLRRKASFSARPPVSRLPNAPLPRLPTSPDKSRSVSPEKKRSISPEKRRPVALQRSTTTTARARDGSTSSQNNDGSNSKPRLLTRTATAPGRPSMAATMTTGEKGSMHRRLSPRVDSPSSPAELPTYERKNSNLYKELDDILKPGRGKARGTTAAGSSQATRRDNRPFPLRRAATSKIEGKNTESPRSPIQRMFSMARTGSLKKKGDRDSGEKK
ncbi:hypothetical protein K469DRAFT_718480 [Zopfia rhizophila CBS 207.26]|uniref:Uncharacterized protein n=1 Tax=Zopfia rhizophila CBS 207.26 TaxID=1314779 RepID=A0A6A6DLB1_9PEZI|nr:hypothetical protein K469DRAFT_718480 [Zopfia rhizophila CBS 207.26]